MAKNKFETLQIALGKAKTIEEFKKIAEEAISEGIIVIVTNGEQSVELLKRAQAIVDSEKIIEAMKSDLALAQGAIDSEKAAHLQTQTDAQSMIADLKTQLLNSEKQVEEGSSKVEVLHEKVAYLVVVPKFKFNGIEYEAKELKTKPSVVAELVECGAGILVKK